MLRVVEEELPVLREAAEKATEMEVPQIPDLEVVEFGGEPTGEDAGGGGVEMLQVRTGIFVGAGLMVASSSSEGRTPNLLGSKSVVRSSGSGASTGMGAAGLRSPAGGIAGRAPLGGVLGAGAEGGGATLLGLNIIDPAPSFTFA